MSGQAKTTWGRALAEARKQFPALDIVPGCEQIDVTSFAVFFLCNELDAAKKRIAELERNLAEMARGGRR